MIYLIDSYLELLNDENIECSKNKAKEIIDLFRDRIFFMRSLVDESKYLFIRPSISKNHISIDSLIVSDLLNYQKELEKGSLSIANKKLMPIIRLLITGKKKRDLVFIVS